MCVCVCVCAHFMCVCVVCLLCVCICVCISEILNKRLHQKPSRGACSKRTTKLAATADLLIPSEKITLAGILAISAQNPGVGLETMITFLS